jgi:hypothetical protein
MFTIALEIFLVAFNLALMPIDPSIFLFLVGVDQDTLQAGLTPNLPHIGAVLHGCQ